MRANILFSALILGATVFQTTLPMEVDEGYKCLSKEELNELKAQGINIFQHVQKFKVEIRGKDKFRDVTVSSNNNDTEPEMTLCVSLFAFDKQELSFDKQDLSNDENWSECGQFVLLEKLLYSASILGRVQKEVLSDMVLEQDQCTNVTDFIEWPCSACQEISRKK